ncbi:outer membrane assembly lipoprotein YfiO [Candidatus Nitrosoglobus terrae]|uniref:Outer membrane protein assembly factor BamD n=1 Tax=Candidatus Nitrosoglobus terrae TaxID=1630141 RepID=A0A1Q2SLF2_9GAMM|nr:outer membrane protein assembly factor BamD [Candidatus Nitrosoglobus terrae]BAW79943.1 outer membrane assembly lipoprotein YfiO [Candidatus Nitrosoglobus terrae]
MRTLSFLLLLLILSLAGCSSLFGGDKKHTSDKKQASKEKKENDWTVERYYAEAKSALDVGDYQKAAKLYEQLESRYPFGAYAQQALLESAYAYYKSNEPESALAALDRFIHLYPLNDHMDYALYLKGLVNFERGVGVIQKYVPQDETQRDPASAEEALKDFKTLVKRFPKSQYAQDSAQRIVYLRNRLAQHEVNIAQYYMRRGVYIGAINRAKYVIENYQRTLAIPEALSIIVRGYKILGLQELAQENLRVLESNFPTYPDIKKLKKLKITK